MVMYSDTSEKLAIALINAYESGDRVASFAGALHNEYLQHGHHSTFWVGRIRGRSPSAETYAIPATPEERRAMLRHVWKGFHGLGIDSSRRFCRSKSLADIDIVHLHNAHEHYMSLDAIPVLARRVPLVWSIHDYHPITGGCVFPSDCEKWRDRCGRCPEIGSYPLTGEYDRTRRIQAVKKNVFQDLPATIVCPTHHLAKTVAESGVFRRAGIQVIPYGVDKALFVANRRLARHRLGLSPSRPMLLLATNELADSRDDWRACLEAIGRIDVTGLLVLVTGMADGQAVADAAPNLDIRPMGCVSSRETMAEVYTAANLMVSTSASEVFPVSIQESMACGTAVLAFDSHGAREQIEPHETGFLVPGRDASKLAAIARELLHHREQLDAVGQAAHRYAVRHWSMDQCVDRHLELYQSVLAQRSVTPVG